MASTLSVSLRTGLILGTMLALGVESDRAIAAPAPPPPGFLVQPYLQLPTPTSIRVLWETNRELPGAVEYGTTPELGQVLRVGFPGELHEICLHDLKPESTYYYRV